MHACICAWTSMRWGLVLPLFHQWKHNIGRLNHMPETQNSKQASKIPTQVWTGEAPDVSHHIPLPICHFHGWEGQKANIFALAQIILRSRSHSELTFKYRQINTWFLLSVVVNVLESCCEHWIEYRSIATEGNSSCESLGKAYSSTAQHINLFYVRFLFKDTLFNIFLWFISLNSGTKAPWLVHERNVPNSYIFSVRYISLLVLRKIRLHFSTMLEGILNSKTTNKKYKIFF